MAHPQPDRSELDQALNGPTPSLADAHLPGAPLGVVWLTMCAWCGRTKVRGRWVDAAHGLEVIGRLGKLDTQITHGICPTCFDEVTGARGQRAS